MASEQEPNTSEPVFTCNSCQVGFRDGDAQRTHMHGDWHRYNLKRRMESLPPVDAEAFAGKAATAKSSVDAISSRATFEQTCDYCRRSYFSHNSYENHITSKRHKQNMADSKKRGGARPHVSQPLSPRSALRRGSSMTNAEKPNLKDGDGSSAPASQTLAIRTKTHGRRSSASTASINENRDEDAEHHISSITPASKQGDAQGDDKVLERCLFCNYLSPAMKLNLLHMSKIHGMFIPEEGYLTDLEGLIKYLDDKVRLLHECLKCGKTRDTSEGIQTHMRDKGHCNIGFENEFEQIEIGQFYDFRGTYSDEEDEDSEEEFNEEYTTSAPLILGGKRSIKVETITPPHDSDHEIHSEKDVDEGGWETDSSNAESDDPGVLRSDHDNLRDRLQRHSHHSTSTKDMRPHRHADGYHSHSHHSRQAVFYADNELHLPSGRTVGHRSNQKYFKQNVNAKPLSQSALNTRHHDSDTNVDMDGDGEGRQRGRPRAPVSRANGGQGTKGVTDQKKREIDGLAKLQRKQQLRGFAKTQWRNNKQSNSQKHFRDPLLQ